MVSYLVAGPDGMAGKPGKSTIGRAPADGRPEGLVQA